MSIKNRLEANSATYQRGNPSTSRTQLVTNILGIALFLVLAVLCFTKGLVGAGILMLVIAGVAGAALYLLLLGRKRTNSRTP